MIEFTDSFSQAAVAEACQAFPELRAYLLRELTLPTFERPLNDTGEVIGAPQVMPLTSLRKTVLYVSHKDIDGHIPREIGFCRYLQRCDTYGVPFGPWLKVINGCYFNHGSNTQPNWSAHS
ncbi:hypothetical protein [Shewanella algae]|uniref:hypothetical protein n=1 Tax=Shewanella algae TaxID=38313 RepID=UPI0012DC5B38|nr:hypothetical protein [Shewanella algae]QGS59034.1 hypothetical protein GMX02_05540 [Shewanella algae]